MSRIRELAGTGACLVCAAEIPVKRSGGEGALSWCCPYCDLSAYARPGTQAFALLQARIKARPGPAPEPAPVVVPTPAPARARSGAGSFTP